MIPALLDLDGPQPHVHDGRGRPCLLGDDGRRRPGARPSSSSPRRGRARPGGGTRAGAAAPRPATGGAAPAGTTGCRWPSTTPDLQPCRSRHLLHRPPSARAPAPRSPDRGRRSPVGAPNRQRTGSERSRCDHTAAARRSAAGTGAPLSSVHRTSRAGRSGRSGRSGQTRGAGCAHGTARRGPGKGSGASPGTGPGARPGASGRQPVIKYLGSKRRLVPVLGDLFARSGAETALDLFTGTTRVAQEFKRRGGRVTAVDTARYAEVFARCHIATDAGRGGQGRPGRRPGPPGGPARATPATSPRPTAYSLASSSRSTASGSTPSATPSRPSTPAARSTRSC